MMLAAILAIWTMCSLVSEARGPDDREKREKFRSPLGGPPARGEVRTGPSNSAPSINRSVQRPQLSTPAPRQFSVPNLQGRQPTTRQQTPQSRSNFSPETFKQPRSVDTAGSRPRVNQFSRPSVQTPPFQQGLPRVERNLRQSPNQAPVRNFLQQPSRSFGARPSQGDVQQFLRLPQGRVGVRPQQGLGRVGAAAIGGAAGAVALDQFMNHGRQGRSQSVSSYMPSRGYPLSARLTPDSAQAIRKSYPARYPGTFNKVWWAQRPALSSYYWHSRIWPYRPWNYWWRPATWVALGSWIAWNWGPPIFYDYGSNFYYLNNFVYLNGRRICSAYDYYNQAAQIVVRIPEVKDEVDEWMSLGVFVLTQDPTVDSNVVIQLAVNKDGIIQGTYYNGDTNTTKPVKGMVEKENQRAVWTFADDSGATVIMETGIYNLTLDQTGVLVHLGKSQTEQWFMVRLHEPANTK